MLLNCWRQVLLHFSLHSHGDVLVLPHNRPPPVSSNVPGKCYPEGDQMLQLAVLNHLSGKPQNYGHGNCQQRASSCFLSSILFTPKTWQHPRDQGHLLGQTAASGKQELYLSEVQSSTFQMFPMPSQLRWICCGKTRWALWGCKLYDLRRQTAQIF